MKSWKAENPETKIRIDPLTPNLSPLRLSPLRRLCLRLLRFLWPLRNQQPGSSLNLKLKLAPRRRRGA